MAPWRFLIVSVVLLGGCTTSPHPSRVSEPPSEPESSPLAGIVPADATEADLLAHPEDLTGLGRHAILLKNRSAVASSPEEARKLRQRARLFALATIQGGSQSLILRLMVQSIREDGSEVTSVHSADAEADKLIAQGEKKFERGDLDGALTDYMAARELDPGSARVALFIGDVYFVRKDDTTALEWFDRSIELAPDHETAHRYRADALMRLRRVDEAGESYLSAVVAHPYSPFPLRALEGWAQRNQKTFQRPHFDLPAGSLAAGEGRLEMNHDPNSGALSFAYLMARAKFFTERKAKPADYRHSLAEEAHALKALIQIADEMRSNTDSAKELETWQDALTFLRRMIDDGLLEAHVLLDRADVGIAEDYAAYRAQHSHQIRKYVRKIWLSDN